MDGPTRLQGYTEMVRGGTGLRSNAEARKHDGTRAAGSAALLAAVRHARGVVQWSSVMRRGARDRTASLWSGGAAATGRL